MRNLQDCVDLTYFDSVHDMATTYKARWHRNDTWGMGFFLFLPALAKTNDGYFYWGSKVYLSDLTPRYKGQALPVRLFDYTEGDNFLVLRMSAVHHIHKGVKKSQNMLPYKVSKAWGSNGQHTCLVGRAVYTGPAL